MRPSIEEAPQLDLKPLPPNLKYAYLADKKTLPIIISATLSSTQEDMLLETLKKHKGAIGWTLADIKGIGHSLCMHKIQLEEGKVKPIEQQRRLNPMMKEVVRKKILKWLDAGIIYPIANSS